MVRRQFSLVPVAPGEYVTLREAHCLVTLLETRGTRREIAIIMGISYRTVDVYLDALRKKFRCHRRRELIDKGLLCDWDAWRHEIKALNIKPLLKSQRSKKNTKKTDQESVVLQKEQEQPSPALLFIPQKIKARFPLAKTVINFL